MSDVHQLHEVGAVPCGLRHGREWDRCSTGYLCPNCTELLALRRRVAELEATAARRLELLRPFADCTVLPGAPPAGDFEGWIAWDAPRPTVGNVCAAAAEVAGIAAPPKEGSIDWSQTESENPTIR